MGNIQINGLFPKIYKKLLSHPKLYIPFVFFDSSLYSIVDWLVNIKCKWKLIKKIVKMLMLIL
jgi:hypothetical protein